MPTLRSEPKSIIGEPFRFGDITKLGEAGVIARTVEKSGNVYMLELRDTTPIHSDRLSEIGDRMQNGERFVIKDDGMRILILKLSRHDSIIEKMIQ